MLHVVGVTRTIMYATRKAHYWKVSKRLEFKVLPFLYPGYMKGTWGEKQGMSENSFIEEIKF